MDLDAVADELYALRPEEFVAARDRRALDARRAGEQGLAAEIGALRRPSLAAWVSNLLVRREPDEVPPLLALGEELRRAHRELDGPRLRRLARRQNEVIGALARQARRLAGQSGHPVGEGVQREVEKTLHAALADADAAREWAAGRLVKPLHATVGFPAAGATPPDRRTATPASGPGKRATDDEPTGDPDHAPGERPRVRPDRAGRQTPTSRPDREAEEERRESRRRLAEARTRAREAERDLRAREQEAEAAEDEAAEAGARAAELEERVRKLQDRLREARAGQGEARAAARAARERSRRAGQAVREARRRAVAATERADRPTPG
ncbi:hypothetical protein ABT203_25170 [Streptomyces sp900105245]|uniref:hypothetical protein n=1 Tax=Streptomyces sp. 900105245 TaxID=3154379 RepID=UPI00332556D3